MKASRSIDWLFLAGVILCTATTTAFAHTRSESFSRWTISGDEVSLLFTVLQREITRLPAENGTMDASFGRLADYLRTQLSVRVGDQRCQQLALFPLTASRGYTRVEGSWRCPGLVEDGAELLVGFSAFFDRVPSHINFARFRFESGAQLEFLYTDADREWRSGSMLPGEARAAEHSSFVDFLRLGIDHILSGLDHLAFLLGVMLICRRLRDLAFVITGFTMGHSLTLALAVLGVVRPNVAVIEATIGLTIALVAAENFVLSLGRASVIAAGAAMLLAGFAALTLLGHGQAPVLLLAGLALFSFCYLRLVGEIRAGVRFRIAITSLFGLIHGFGFANALMEGELPAGRLVPALFGFNLGVEIGQLLLVCAALAGLFVLRRLQLDPPRAASVELTSAGLVGVGLFWFVERAFA